MIYYKYLHQNSFLAMYMEKIENGEIIACKKLKKQLKMLWKDIVKTTYIFNIHEAKKRIRFIESHCKHSISPFAGKPFYLELWQKAFIEACYGFYMRTEDGIVRRFNRALLVIGRKNGKSTFASALALAEMYCGNMGTNIVCASNDYAQCGIVFDEINNMREWSPSLEKVSRKIITGIFMGNRKQKKKTGKFSRQNKAKVRKLSAKTGAKEGGNIDFAVIDEIHEMKDNGLVMPIVQSTSTKDECLIIEITTEGFTENGYMDDEMETCADVLNEEIEAPRRLYWIYEQDSEEEVWQEPDSWVKSNPNLGVSKKRQYVTDMIQSARRNKSERSFMLAKDFNIKQNSGAAWLDIEVCNGNGTFEIKDFMGKYYIGGYDFAETTDLLGMCFLFEKPEDKTLYMHFHYWIPKAKIYKNHDDIEGAKYEEWARDGWITIVDDTAVESSIVADYAYTMYKDYDIKPYKGGYDNRFAKDFINKHDGTFGKGLLENVPQDFKCLSTPMRTMEGLLSEGRINHQENPVTEWCLKNTGIVLDNMGRCMPRKIKTTKRIDGTAAALCAMHILAANKTEFTILQ